jgi:leucyl aminopeptidase
MAVANKYQDDGVAVFSMMQLDMTFYTKPGTTPSFGIITDYVNADLTAFLKTLVESYSELKYVTSKCGYGCSDHASWTKAGYASCLPFETSFANSDPYIHTSSDTIDKLNLDHGLEFAKVGLGYIVELSS